MKRGMKTSSWRKDLRLNAARCFSVKHTTVRFTKETLVTSGSHREACFHQGYVNVENATATSHEEEDEATLVAEGHQIGRGTVFLRDT